MNVSVIGLGIMGRAIVSKLMESGENVIVWNRTESVADEFVERGATKASSPADAAANSDVVLSIVTNPAAVNDITLGADGILEGLPFGTIHAEMSTVSPESASKLASVYAEKGKRFVQAPVMGSRIQIENKALLIVAGGDEQDIDSCVGIWNQFAKQVWRVPNAEQASAVKLSINMLLAQMLVALGQSFSFAKAFEIDPAMILEIVMQSSLASPQYQSKGTAILKGDYTPNFTVTNLLKDLNLMKDAGSTLPGSFPMTEAVRVLFEKAVADGLGAEDYSAVVKAVADTAKVTL